MPIYLVIQQFARYVLVGGLAFIVDFTALFFLTESLEFHYLVSASIAFLLGLVTNYLLCISWIFHHRTVSNRLHEFIIFSLVGIAGLLLNNLLIFLLTEFVSFHYLMSKAVAAAVILVFNFSLRRSLLFAETQKMQLKTP